MVVRTNPYEPDKYGVLLDGEDQERELVEEELEALHSVAGSELQESGEAAVGARGARQPD